MAMRFDAITEGYALRGQDIQVLESLGVSFTCEDGIFLMSFDQAKLAVEALTVIVDTQFHGLDDQGRADWDALYQRYERNQVLLGGLRLAVLRGEAFSAA